MLFQQRNLDILKAGQACKQLADLEAFAQTHVGDLIGRLFGNFRPVEKDFAFVGAGTVHDLVHEGRFTGAVRTDNRMHFPIVDVQADIVGGFQRTKPAHQMFGFQNHLLFAHLSASLNLLRRFFSAMELSVNRVAGRQQTFTHEVDDQQNKES